MISNQANFLQSIGWAALNSLWQMAFLWILFQVVISIFKLKPSMKSTLASSFLITGFAWFIFTFFTSLIQPNKLTSFSTGILNINGDQQINSWFLQSLPVASILYLALLIFPILRFVRNYRYVQIIRRYGLSKINIDSRIYINKTAFHLGIKRKVQIWISELVSSPVTIGFFKPVILIPIAAINQLSTQQLEAILLHELAHIKRNDYFINLVINIIQTILYFNPFVKVFIKITESEREQSCDEMVLQFQYNSHEYASALLTLEKSNHSHQFLTLPASGKKTVLLRRVETILSIKNKKPFNAYKLAGLVLTISFIFTMNFLFQLSNQTTSVGILSTEKVLPKPGLIIPVDEPTQIAFSELPVTSVINKPAQTGLNAPIENTEDETYIPGIIPSEVMNVAFNLTTTPALKSFQEEQIKSALEASKKVLENSQWKLMEQNIADVFTSREKEELKESYQTEIEKFDWRKWENRLRTAYNNVNWEKVNSQLNNAVTQIRIDSLQNVYSNAAIRLNEVQRELASKRLEGIPDTDISLESIMKKKEMVQNILNELRAVKVKKTVHL